MKLPVSIVCAFFVLTAQVRAADVTVAVASNFLSTAEELAEAFMAKTEHEIVLTHGSTGQIFAQVMNGAPFDIFLSADAARPARLVEEGKAVDSRTYAFGKLVLVSRDAVTPETVAEAMVGENVALADPTVAPYGLAATAAMESLSLDTATFQPILVANVGQAATVFVTRNADFAFVAASLLPKIENAEVLALDNRHPPITQDAARITPPADSAAVDDFWAFLFSESARDIISKAGYELP